MAHVLAMAALKLRDPIEIPILMEAGDFAGHEENPASRITASREEVTAQFVTFTFTELLPTC
jgi:hypothetical protein